MKVTIGTITAAMALGMLFGAGCGRDREYSDDRPPVDSLAPGNTGLQAKDVVAASDHMASDLLAVPELNASDHQWTVVITKVENHTTDPTFSYDAFSQHAARDLARQGHGRVALIENRATYKKLQNEELDPAGSDANGHAAAAAAGQNPDYGLYITIDEMPNRATSYYLVTATLTNLSTRALTWTSNYEVQTAR